jgi:hypothetical protein
MPEKTDNLLHNVVKHCRACHSETADDDRICVGCGLRKLSCPATPAKLQRVWKLAALCVGALGLLSASLAMGVVRHKRSQAQGSRRSTTSRSNRGVVYQRAFVLEEETRKVYPYSIVPGGASSVEEAKLAMNQPGVRANYAAVNMAQLREVKLTANLAGYVSYRYGEKIYWTAKKLTLRAGETVFTDGVHIVRGRCLNCYSATPMLPIRPHEPTEKVLDTPVDVPLFAYKFPMLPVETPTLPPPPEELTPTVPTLSVVAPITPGVPGGGIWFPIIPIIPPIHRHHNPTPTVPTPTGPTPTGPVQPPGVINPVSTPPPAVVPEPNLGWLLIGGFGAMVLTHRLRKRVTLRVPNLSIEKFHADGTSVVEP